MPTVENPADICIVCRRANAFGYWQVCDGCRRDLAQRSAQRQAAMAPDHCLGCFTPRQYPHEAGAIYCPRCISRFARHAR
jgi:hypothetical protein